MYHRINNILYFVCYIGTLFCVSSVLPESIMLPKWYFFWFSLGMILVVSSALCHWEKPFSKSLDNRAFLYAMLAVLMQNVYALIKYLFLTADYMSGSFDNPAGLVASIGVTIPFVFLCKEEHLFWKVCSILFVLTSMSIIVFANSRLGTIVFVFVFLFYLLNDRIIKGFAVPIVAVCFIFGCISLITFTKTGSSLGRYFIIRCTIKMIMDRPLFGFGYGGFASNYMEYQANFIETHPQSDFSIFAGEIQHPLNEYLRFVVDYGLLGFSLFVVTVICFFNRVHFEGSMRPVLVSIINLLLICCFSYPLSYPFVWMLLIVELFSILDFSQFKFLEFIVSRYRLLLVLGSLIVAVNVHNLHYDMKWGELMNAYEMPKDKIQSAYLSLMPALQNKSSFLYQYATKMFEIGEYEKAFEVASSCASRCSDYNLEMLLGEISKSLFSKTDSISYAKSAEYHFKRASLMCPSRFRPEYALLLLYKTTKDIPNEKLMAERLLCKQVKIETAEIERIKQVAQMCLINNYN